MKKLIAGALLGATMLSSAANAVLIVNDGPSLNDLNKFYVENGWTHHPKASGALIPGYLGGKFLNFGTLLPEIKDPLAIKRAFDLKGKKVLVAGNDFVLPCSPFMVELAKQNGISCIEMTKYLFLNTPEVDDNGNEIVKTEEMFIEMAKSYTDAITQIAVDLEIVKDTPEISTLQSVIDSLNADLDANQITIDKLESTIRDLRSELADMPALITAADLLNEYNRGFQAGQAQVIDNVEISYTTVGNNVYSGITLNTISPQGERGATTISHSIDVSDVFENGRRAGVLSVNVAEIERLAEERGVASVDVQAAISTALEDARRAARLTFSAPNVEFDGTVPTPSEIVNHTESSSVTSYAPGQAEAGDYLIANVTSNNSQVVLIDSNGNGHFDRGATITSDQTISLLGGVRQLNGGQATTFATSDAVPYFGNPTNPTTTARYLDMAEVTVNFGGFLTGTTLVDADGNNIVLTVGQTITDTVLASIEDAIENAYEQGYADGYEQGYADGYADGFRDGVNSVQ